MLKNQYVTLLGILCLAVGISGCASEATVGGMAVTSKYSGSAPVSSKLKNNIELENVKGGEETNPILESKVSNENFRQALNMSLKKAGFSAKLNKADYTLEASIISLDQPIAGLDMEVKIVVNYKLISNKGKSVVYFETITTKYTAGFSDSPMAIKRLRLANEGAARTNIDLFIKKLYKLKI